MPRPRKPRPSSPVEESSPASFVTATASPRDPPLPQLDASSPPPSPYRNACQLPPELKQHCRIYLEENLPIISLNLLNTILEGQRGATKCPPPNQLSFLATMVIHPDFTTRPKEPHWSEAAAEALGYLRSLFSLVGPVNARFDDAFRFGTPSRWSRGDDMTSSDMDEDDDDDQSPLAGKYPKDGIWRRGQDFFSVIGWAFNCSVLFPTRWRYYKRWLDFMLDVLEADLHERLRLDQANQDEDMPMLRKSMLATYITQRSGRTGGGLKWIIKAIFADGSKSSNSFQEIWHKEHKGISKKAMNKRKRERVDLDKGDFGGYMDDESLYSASEPPTPQKRRTKAGNFQDADFQALHPAFVESIPLRQRLFALLSSLFFHHPEPSFENPDLYEQFALTTKSLPLPIFSEFIDITSSNLRVDSQISILQDVITLLMPSSSLSPAKVDKALSESGGISADILERCYLPYAANTISVDDNAKVSLLIENLFRLVIEDGTHTFGPGLRAAMNKGIKARETKMKKKPTRGRPSHIGSGGEDPDAEARVVLELSAERLGLLVDITEMDDESTEEEDNAIESMEVDEIEEDDDDDDEVDATFMTAVED